MTLREKLIKLAASARAVAADIASGRITPRAGCAFSDGEPVCAFGEVLHRAGMVVRRDEKIGANSLALSQFLAPERNVKTMNAIYGMTHAAAIIQAKNDNMMPRFRVEEDRKFLHVSKEKRLSVAASVRLFAKECLKVVKENNTRKANGQQESV
jgi:hypothetical protein